VCSNNPINLKEAKWQNKKISTHER
jgi:hypothetical protein